MKIAASLLVLATVLAVAFAQCDTEGQNLFGAWAAFRDTGAFSAALWEEEELMAWGMDGNNKWNAYWIGQQFNSLTNVTDDTRYNRATCLTTSQGAVPDYSPMCGDCSITAALEECLCYPYYDVAQSYQESPKPLEGEPATAPEGWSEAYEIGNPPFSNPPLEVLDPGSGGWTFANCLKYKPAYVYYYTLRLRLGGADYRDTVRSSQYEKSYGISKAFEPSDAAWEDFCEALHENPPVTHLCPVPSSEGGIESHSIVGAHYQYQSGTWREDFVSRAQFFADHFESGCHPKSRDDRWPTANYCGGPSGWKFGAGVTAHVHYGCDVSTFFDTETDLDEEIDDEDCGSVYVLFDETNPLDVTVDHYDQHRWATFRDSGSDVNDETCWYRSSFIDHRSDTPSYRTPCAGSQTVVSLFAVFAAVLVGILRNLF